MMTIHLSLHPDLSIVPGHPNLPGDSSTTESDNDFDATLFLSLMTKYVEDIDEQDDDVENMR